MTLCQCAMNHCCRIGTRSRCPPWVYDKTIHIMKPGDYGAHRSALGEAPPAFVADNSVARSAGRFHRGSAENGSMQGVLYEGVWESIEPNKGAPQASADRASRRGRVAVQVDARRSRQRTRTPPWGSTSLRGPPIHRCGHTRRIGGRCDGMRVGLVGLYAALPSGIFGALQALTEGKTE